MKPSPSNTQTQKVEQDITATEQAADLAALEAEAASAPDGGGLVAPAAPAGPDLAAEIGGLVTVAVATLGPLFPSLKATYTPEVTQAAAQAVAAVCRKHGWLEGGMMGRYGEELACLAVVGPLAYQTYVGVRADLAARAPAKPTESIAGADLTAPVPTAPVGQNRVTFGAAA